MDKLVGREGDVFREKTKTRKSLFLTMITTCGLKRNPYYTGLVQREIVMDQLFKPGREA